MKVLIKIKDNKLAFYNRKKLNQEYKNMLNTNVISNDELVFSDEYINANPKLIITFLNDLIRNYSLDTIVFQNMEVVSLILPLLNKIKNIISIVFASDEVLQYNTCECLCKLNDLKYVSAQYIPQYIFEMLDSYKIIPESRNEILFTSSFMEINGLNTYASLYYKHNINLDFPMSYDELNDFIIFCKINRQLKIINVNSPNRTNLEEIINVLKDYKHKNVKILINGDSNDNELIEYLRKNNKKIKKKFKIIIKLKYSDKYIKENIIKETNNNILRSCAIIMLSIVGISIGYLFYDNYKSMKNNAKISNELINYIDSYQVSESDINKYQIKTKETIEQETPSYEKIQNDYFYALKSINENTVGWIKVNNTNIDYPVVQYTDNYYYLDHNIYNNTDENGWIFMDYENNETELDDNTIIYGHNRYINGVMFGTLNKVLYQNWYNNEENQIIKFDTMYHSYKFKVFSIYTIATTTDYLTTTFNSAAEKLNFINLIKDRSIYDFKQNLDETSKILTLSTCHSDTTRLVVHALLIEEN